MRLQHLFAASALCILVSSPVRAQDATVTYKSLGLELALDAARAALAECQKRGYQVAVAVVDRFGTPQVLLRDRLRRSSHASHRFGQSVDRSDLPQQHVRDSTPSASRA